MITGGHLDETFEQLADFLHIIDVVGGGAGLLTDRAGKHGQVGGDEGVARADINLSDGSRKRGERFSAASLNGASSNLSHDGKHRLIAMIVSEDKTKVNLRSICDFGDVLDDVHSDDALVHAAGTDLDVSTLLHAAVKNVDGEATKDVGQMVLELARLQITKLWIRIAILPKNLHLSLLNVGSMRTRCVDLHNGDGD